MYLPCDLDAALIPLVAARAPRFIDHYRWIIHSIIYQRLTDRRYKDRGSYVPLNQTILRKYISQHKAKQFLTDLRDWKFIEWLRGYTPGAQSMVYRIRPPYDQAPIIGIEITDALLAEKVQKHVQKEHETIRARGDGYSAVLEWLEALTIDEVSANEHVTKNFKATGDSYNSRILAIDAIANRQHRFIIDGSGRAHHNLSNLAGDLRPFVSIGGRPLYQVDIACSQAWFMDLNLRDGIQDSLERTRMEELLASGKFYPELNTKQIDIDAFKKAFFQDVLCGRGDYSNSTTRSFEALFPSYARAIREAKGDNYKQFAVALQRAEAHVVFDAVDRFVTATGGKVPILTIHDSLVTWPDWTHTARDALEAVFHDRHGVKPLLRLKAPTSEIKSKPKSKRSKPRKMTKKERLTCVEITPMGTVSKKWNLVRFNVRFSNGDSGEYWGKSEASVKNFPIGVSYWYKSEVLTKRDGSTTRKYAPCTKDEIPPEGHNDMPSPAMPAPDVSDGPYWPTSAAASVPQPEGPSFPSGGATAEDIAAMKGALELVAAGKISLDQVDETAALLKKTLTNLSNQ